MADIFFSLFQVYDTSWSLDAKTNVTFLLFLSHQSKQEKRKKVKQGFLFFSFAGNIPSTNADDF